MTYMTNIISNFSEWKANVNSKFDKPFQNPPSPEYFSIFEDVFGKSDKFMGGPVVLLNSNTITAGSLKTPFVSPAWFRTLLEDLQYQGFIPYRFFISPTGDIILRGGKS